MPHLNDDYAARGLEGMPRWPGWVGFIFVLASAAALWAGLWLLFMRIMGPDA